MTALTQVQASAAASVASRYPRLRYMGSKYSLLPDVERVLLDLGGATVADPFSGSGVVSYLAHAMGREVWSSDYLAFPCALTRATVANRGVRLGEEDLAELLGPSRDERSFIHDTYAGILFTAEDLRALDSAWSVLASWQGPRRDLAIASLILAAARKQPRGVFTVTSSRYSVYDDGRRHLRMSMREHIREAAADWNRAVCDDGAPARVRRAPVDEAPRGADVVYLDPPYAPPRDDNDYIKRYWFLEGLADYWNDGRAQVMESTLTRKLPKRPTPFGSRRTIEGALEGMLERFSDSSLVLSYGSNAVPGLDRLVGMVRDVKGNTEVRRINHRYHFGTARHATRRQAVEYLVIGE
ncbi:DNA adenine methylase [Actinomyces capricornis]|uniref:site-specific DNA-methyltransferase (adenine-specific) n=1 Tax=Actinomyces capricornis TaxID=2755559 RepID=A0ABM7UA78_9ACTO|nr:DNA adenine methylase [Actinomyces capricornis]BDA64257.1 (2Fe-2S)-binding protein [Actinomyces capricornis]